jgi:1,4-alpha-glucan branching enzyme
MGNEFGHPEWIDFPREGNLWSYAYARRQWSLAEDEGLRYHHLGAFDRDLMALARSYGVPDGQDEFLLLAEESAKVLAWLRAGLVFVLNFHPSRSFTDYSIPAPPGTYRTVLDTDRRIYGGFERQAPDVEHHAIADRIQRHFLRLYLPARTGLVLAPSHGVER